MNDYYYDDPQLQDDDFTIKDDDFIMADGDFTLVDDDFAVSEDDSELADGDDAVCDDERDGMLPEEVKAYELEEKIAETFYKLIRKVLGYKEWEKWKCVQYQK